MDIFDKKFNPALRSGAWINIEVLNAVIIIALVSLLVLGGFTAGFVLPLFLITMSASFLIALAYPRSGIYATVFLTFIFERFFTLAPIYLGREEYKLYPLDIILAAVFIGALLRITNFTKLRTVFNEGKYLIIFMLLAGIHFLVDIFSGGADKSIAFSSFKYYVFYPLIYFAILALFNRREDVLRLLKFALAGAVGVIFFIFYGIIFGGGLWTEFTPLSTSGMRILAFTHAFYISMAALALWAWMLFEEKRSLWPNILLAIWLIGIVGSMMRHLWIGLFFSAIAVYFLVSVENRRIFWKKVFRYSVFAIIAIIAIFYISLVFPYYTRTAKVTDGAINSIEQRVRSFSDVGGDESFSWRELVWKEVFKDYAESPVWGIGFGKKIYVETDSYRDFVEVRDIHNSWITLFMQTGPIIFAIFAIFLFKSFKNIFKRRREDWINTALLVLMLNYFIIALFQPYWETNMLGIFFWIILGLMGAVSLNLSENKKDNFYL